MKLAVDNEKKIGTSERFLLLEDWTKKAERFHKEARSNHLFAKKSEFAKLAYLDCIRMLGGRDDH